VKKMLAKSHYGLSRWILKKLAGWYYDFASLDWNEKKYKKATERFLTAFLVADFFYHLFKPVAITTSLDPYNHFATELTVECSHLITLMVQFLMLDAPIFSVQVTPFVGARGCLLLCIMSSRVPPFCDHTTREFNRSRFAGRPLYSISVRRFRISMHRTD
jgi:hypothetical protein